MTLVNTYDIKLTDFKIKMGTVDPGEQFFSL